MNIKQILNTAVGGIQSQQDPLRSGDTAGLPHRRAAHHEGRHPSAEPDAEGQRAAAKVIRTSVKVLLYVLTVIITAEALGINTSSLTALLSVLTLGITLAAEDILGNVAGGLVILSSHPFALGDFIEAGGTSGTVREIGLNHTKLETANGQMILMPNKDLSSSKIINYTVLGRRRIVRTVTASYDAPTETVMTACMEAVEATANILPDPGPGGASYRLRRKLHRIHHLLLVHRGELLARLPLHQ